MPLIFVLSDMEKEGVCVDGGALKEYSKELAASIDVLENVFTSKQAKSLILIHPNSWE